MQDYPAAFYDALHKGTPGDLEHYRRHCPRGSSVLELGCGSGRVLAALRETASRRVGVDLHPGLLGRAKKALDASVELHEQDMLALDLNENFDRILLPFCGIYCIESDHDLERLFAGIKAHLHLDGSFIVDSYNAELFHGQDDLPDEEQAPHEHGPISVDGVEYRVFEQSRWDRSQQKILVSYLHAAIDPDAARAAELEDEIIAELPHHYWLKAQLEAAASKSGLKLTKAWGSFDNDRWEPASPWNIFHFQHAERSECTAPAHEHEA